MESLASLKVAELKERLEGLGLPTNGLKADLIERLKAHMEENSTNESGAPHAEVSHTESHIRDDSPRHQPASPKHQPASPKRHHVEEVAEKTTDSEMHVEGSPADSKPSAAELARKRAERFGIPVVTADAPAAPVVTEKPEDHEVEDAPKTEARTPLESFDTYQPLLASSIPEGSIIESADFVIDHANLKRIEKVIQLHGEDKVKEVAKQVVERINKEFEGDRSKIRAPGRLATSRLSFGLKAIISKSERREPRTDEKSSSSKKNDNKGGKWTEEEWEQWRKEKGQKGGKKDEVKSWKSSGYEKKDWNDKSYKKPNSDPFESDVEEFISRNRLDRRASEAMRTESRGMVAYVMDQGFNLVHKYDNTSKEVIMRMHDYRRLKERGGQPHGRSSARDPSPAHAKNRDRSYSRDRSDSRGRSRSRSYSRDRYARGSRSLSR